ncbi:MAG: tetratricopeptide repeat protein, partial [Acidobacteria bacterium]|nr:tetratricopeptide repeat protein [Acidobacteriota bacterium]
MPESVVSYPRQGAFNTAVAQLRHAFHFNERTSASAAAFTNPAITFELYAVGTEDDETPFIPIVPPNLPPLWQTFRAVTGFDKTLSLPLTAFANPAVADTRPIGWAISSPEKPARKTKPAATESWHEHAQAYFSSGHYEEALECAEQALQFTARPNDVWRLRGTALLSLQRWREAAQAFQRAVTLRAQDAEAWLGFGRAQLQLGECEAALQSFNHALAQIPHYFEALFYQGRAHFQCQDYERACASYAQAAALQTEEVVLWREYGEALLRAHQPEAALECWETVTQLQ